MRLDMRILRGPDWIWIDTEPGADGVLLKTIETYSLGRDVTWESADERIVSVAGRRRARRGSPPPRSTRGSRASAASTSARTPAST